MRPTLIRELLQFNTRNISNRKPFSCEIENLNLRLSKIWVICVTAAPSATLSLSAIFVVIAGSVGRLARCGS